MRNHMIKKSSLAFLVLAFWLMTAASIGQAESESGPGPGKHHWGHGPRTGMEYLTSAQLTSLAALNLTEAQWHCFWQGKFQLQLAAAKGQVQMTPGQKPDAAQRKAFGAAMKAASDAAFAAQLKVAPTASCPRGPAHGPGAAPEGEQE